MLIFCNGLITRDATWQGRSCSSSFGIQVQAMITKMYSLSFTSSALRETASTQSSSGRVGAITSSASNTSRLDTSFVSTLETTSAKTTPNTSFETDRHSGIFRKFARSEPSPQSTVAGAEMAPTHSDDRQSRKRKRDRSGSHVHDVSVNTSTGARSPVASNAHKEVRKDRDKTAHQETCPKDMSNIDHRLKNLPTSGFGTMEHNHKTRSIEQIFVDKLQRLSKVACPLVLKADIKIDVRSGKPLFRSNFDIRDMKRSNQLERRFGWKRFMHAVLPLESQETIVKSNQAFYREQLVRWLMKPKSAFGCEWRAFLIKEIKAERKSLVNGDRIHSGSKIGKQMEVVFFATHGPDVEHITLNNFVRSTLHIDDGRNVRQACLKLYSRFEILLSRTAVGVSFEPTQFRFADDPTPTSKYDPPEVSALTDAHKAIPYETRKHDQNESMTDGNATISVGAALLICQTLGLTNQPTAFQGRILGSKGVWYISAPYNTKDSDHTSIWIQIHKSQRKIFMEPTIADPTELSFNVSNLSFKPKAADLHRDFLPILQDRGVSYETISSLHLEAIRDFVETWLRAIHRPAELALLLHARLGNAGPSHSHTSGVFRPWALTPAEAALHFVEHGFMPCDNHYVAGLVLRTCVSTLADDLTRFRIKCPKSTSIMGITDPYGILDAHQVFFCFSKPIKDDKGNETIPQDGDEVIIARDPTLRPSDMQKFVYAFRPQLTHLQDVVVFSIKGSMPSAAKLQGGDHDGDVFNLSWEPRLTKPFRNVPPPEPKELQRLGVGKITTTLEELMTNEDTGDPIDHFLETAFKFRMQSSLLGVVTNYTNGLTYRHGLWDPRTMDAGDLHGYLIDSLKNGYTFDETDWRLHQQKRGLDPSVPQKWKKSQEQLKDLLEWKPAEDDRNLEQKLQYFLRQAAAPQKQDRELGPIHDRLWFGPLLLETADAIEKLSNALAKMRSKSADPDLKAPLAALKLHDKERRDILTTVRPRLKDVLKSYAKVCRDDINDSTDKYEEIRNEFLSIPAPDCFPGRSQRLMPWAYSEWEITLTSLLLRLQGDDSGKRSILFIATGPLCFMKEHGKTGRCRVKEIAAVKRPRPHLISRMSFETEEEEDVVDDEEFSIPSSMLGSSIWSQ